MKKTNAIIFIADEIHSKGIELLEKNGFEVVKAYGLRNHELIKFISAFVTPKTVGKNTALIIRTVRNFLKKDIIELRKRTNVKLLCTASSGYDNVDSPEAMKQGIHVMNVPEATFLSAAEHTFALLLAIVKNIVRANSDMKSGVFDFKRYTNTELGGKTIGIIGVGRVGSLVAQIARSFGMNILGNDINKVLAVKYKWIEFVTKERLLSSSDIVTVHTPLDPSTKNLINSHNLKKVKNDVIILNCARGGIINERALLASIKAKKVCYAGIDVFENEPDFRKDFCRFPNVILTPHLAGKTAESKLRVSIQLAEGIVGYYSGRKMSKAAGINQRGRPVS